MNKKIQKSILAGIIGTAVMTVVTIFAPMMGMPKMSPPEMLSGMLGIPVFAGWVMHFMIGIIFAFIYVYLFNPILKIKNTYLKGAVFGTIIFIFAQIMMAVMGMVISIPQMEGSMMLTVVGSLMGHVIFGMAVSKMVGNIYCECQTSCETRT